MQNYNITWKSFFHLLNVLKVKSNLISYLRESIISNSPIHGGCITSHEVLFLTSILHFSHNCKLIS